MTACERGTAQIKLRKKIGFGAERKLRVVHEHGGAAGASCLIPQESSTLRLIHPGTKGARFFGTGY